MRRICFLLGLVLVATTAACGTSPYGSTPELESTKLRDVVSSGIARVALDPSLGSIAKYPVITDNEASISQTLIQLTTDRPGREQGLVNAMKRAKAHGAHFYIASCTDPTEISIGGFADIPSSYPGIATWPAGVGLLLVLARTHIPTTDTQPTPSSGRGKTFELWAEISVQGGDKPPRLNRPTTTASATCSKQILSLLE